MSIWADYGYTGMVWGLWLCVVTVPLLGVAQLIFRNRLRSYWLLVCATVTVYATGVISFTMLPLQAPEDFVCSSNPVRTTPFHSLVSLMQATEGYTLTQFLTSVSFLQIFFNILLFVPLGFLARAVFKRGLFTSTLIAFSISLAIELTQLTGLWGYYPCAYRIFDVDDLITNTAGGLIGAAIALVWVTLRPRDEKPLPWGSGARSRSSAEDNPDEEAH